MEDEREKKKINKNRFVRMMSVSNVEIDIGTRRHVYVLIFITAACIHEGS